jgi:Fe-S-cluster containining protein
MKKDPEYTCQRCGKCCLADFMAYAATEDQQRWRNEGRQDILAVIEREHAVWMGDHLVSSEDGHYLRGCPFLAWEEDHSCCTIYETRPQICRNYQPGSSEICSQFKSYRPAAVSGKNHVGKESIMGKRVRIIIALLFVVSASFLFLALDAQAFRCGDEIVGTGDSKARVLIKCGKPTYQEKVGAKKSTRTKGQKRLSGEKQVAYDTRQTTAKGAEKWTYNCGKDDFIYVLTFEGGVVTREETDGRGRGASECLGR